MSATIVEDVVETRTTDNPDEASHIVWVPPGRGVTAKAHVMEAIVNGTEVEALCGHRWVPTRDPRKYPVCEPCLAVFKHDPHGHGDRDRLPDA